MNLIYQLIPVFEVAVQTCWHCKMPMQIYLLEDKYPLVMEFKGPNSVTLVHDVKMQILSMKGKILSNFFHGWNLETKLNCTT